MDTSEESPEMFVDDDDDGVVSLWTFCTAVIKSPPDVSILLCKTDKGFMEFILAPLLAST